MPPTKEPLPDFSEVTVKLKPFLGVAPGRYLTIIYAIAASVLLFAILFLPGIKNNGTLVAFNSVPAGAAIWVDGQYKGATPTRAFVTHGERTIEIRKAFYATDTATRVFRGRVFGSLIFPRRFAYDTDLKIEDWPGLIDWTRSQIGEWGMLRDFSTATPLPPLLSEATGGLRSTDDPEFKQALLDLATEFAFYVDSEAELRELVSGLALTETAGRPLFPVSLHRLAWRIRKLAAPVATSGYWLSSALDASIRSGSIARGLIDTEAFTRFHTDYLADMGRYEDQPAKTASRGPLGVGGTLFVPIPGGILVAGRSPEDSAGRIDPFMPYAASVSPFWMSRDEVSRASFGAFLRSQPQWQKEARVDPPDTYLDGWKGAVYPEGTASLPVVHVDYAAAQAYCGWLSRQLPANLSGYETRLPTENEWDWAARGAQNGAFPVPDNAVFLDSGELKPVDASTPNGLGVRGLWGSVWEWCDDWYFPATHLLASADPSSNPVIGDARGSQRVVKGGSWANSRQEIRRHTRGSQPPTWATAYTGFRVVIVALRKSNG